MVLLSRRYMTAGNTGSIIAETGATPRTATTGCSNLRQAISQALVTSLAGTAQPALQRDHYHCSDGYRTKKRTRSIWYRQNVNSNWHDSDSGQLVYFFSLNIGIKSKNGMPLDGSIECVRYFDRSIYIKKINSSRYRWSHFNISIYRNMKNTIFRYIR